jgi:hypothetical protein
MASEQEKEGRTIDCPVWPSWRFSAGAVLSTDKRLSPLLPRPNAERSRRVGFSCPAASIQRIRGACVLSDERSALVVW